MAGVCEWSLRNSLPTGGIGFVLSGLLTLPAFLIYYGWVYREPLLQRFGIRAIAAQPSRPDGGTEEEKLKKMIAPMLVAS